MEFGAPWYTKDKTSTVWSTTTFGEVLIADCSSKVLTVQSQRVNARLISQAPMMFEMLQKVFTHYDINPQDMEQIQDLVTYVYSKADTGTAKP